MTISVSVSSVVSDVLGNWYRSHTKLDTLFGGVGFPGDPPSGNCVQKCREWFRRANETPNPLELLGGVLVEFMTLDRQENEEWVKGANRITEVLSRNGLAFDLNGVVPTQAVSRPAQESPVKPVDHSSPQASNMPTIPAGPQRKSIILFLASNPDGVNKLALDSECRDIREKIRASDNPQFLEFRTEWAVRPDDLLQYLNEYKPHVVHFSGHGSAKEELIFHDGADRPTPVSKAALRSLFATLKDNIRLVVLNACYSRPQAEAIVEVVDCAVGMKHVIGDEAARVFAASFYRALGFGRSVKDAFDQGRTALLLRNIAEENTPDLLVRQGVNAADIYLAGPHKRHE